MNREKQNVQRASPRAVAAAGRPAFGAWPAGDGTEFRVWAPAARQVDVVVNPDGPAGSAIALERDARGVFEGHVPGVHAGDRYKYRLDGGELMPDPASRFQPDGVHGASQIVDPASFRWTDDRWMGVAASDAVIYEVHVGTFSSAGTFEGVAARLPELVELGVSVIELMPVADFAGDRNWGYDGVCLFAPARCYGYPDDLRRLVDEAHRLGLAVMLDVVYNHLGPDGAYLGAYSPPYFSSRHASPWGAGINLDGPESDLVRAFIIDNARHWVREYHLDGLRLDATHALADDSPRHLVAELAAAVRREAPHRRVLVMAEDHRNLAVMVRRPDEGGWGLDAVWADDFHHQVRRLLAGDADGYYADFSGRTADLARTIVQGWFFCGQHSGYLNEPRGSDPTGLPPERFVICLQNHDQVGNRAFGERLHHQIDLAAWRSALAILLLAPQMPLLFMGQEWGATTPFRYFTDHHDELGRLVTEGRRREFGRFAAFADPAVRERIPDPQAVETFEASRLRWAERDAEPHAGLRRLTHALLALRRAAGPPAVPLEARALDEETVWLHRRATRGEELGVLARLRGSGTIGVPPADARGRWTVALTTNDAAFAAGDRGVTVDLTAAQPTARFGGPAAIVLRAV